MEVYDLFCGAGGFSTGAVAAGAVVAYACDHDEDALATHRANHPNASTSIAKWTCTKTAVTRIDRHPL